MPSVRETAMDAAKWALIGAVVLGVIPGIVMGLFTQFVTVATFGLGMKMGLSFGIPSGVTIGAVAAIVRSRGFGLIKAAATGVAVGAIVSCIHHPLERTLVAQSDLFLLQNMTIGVAVGVFCALVVSLYFSED